MEVTHLLYFVSLQVTESVGTAHDWIDSNCRLILVGIIVTIIIHLVFSFLLILGIILHRRCLILPWLIMHIIFIIIMVFIFISWTFLSYFASLLLAVMFPLVFGLLLGLWISLWQQVLHVFSFLAKEQRTLVAIRKETVEYLVMGEDKYLTRDQELYNMFRI